MLTQDIVYLLKLKNEESLLSIMSRNLRRVFYSSNYARNFSQTANKYAKVCELLRYRNRVLDIGCGDGSFCIMLNNVSPSLELYGIDISKDAVLAASKKGIRAYCLDVDKEKLPFEDNFFDGIFCGEVIEHLYDPDHILDEIYRVLTENGTCVLTTPNLASWYNRIFLLLGYQPFFTEVSLRHGVGHPFPFWLGGGHIRVFTPKALSELVELHGFRILSKIGFGINTRLGYGKRFRILAEVANRLFSRPSLSSDIMLVMTK